MTTADLITLEDIAAMHFCGIRHARDVIVRKPGFPAEAPTSTPRNRLWIRAEVRAFITRKNQAKPRTNPAHRLETRAAA